MLLDKIEAAAHHLHISILIYVDRKRRDLLVDLAVALAYLSKKRAEANALFDKEEKVLIEDAAKVREKLAAAANARKAVADFIQSL